MASRRSSLYFICPWRIGFAAFVRSEGNTLDREQHIDWLGNRDLDSSIETVHALDFEPADPGVFSIFARDHRVHVFLRWTTQPGWMVAPQKWIENEQSLPLDKSSSISPGRMGYHRIGRIFVWGQ